MDKAQIMDLVVKALLVILPLVSAWLAKKNRSMGKVLDAVIVGLDAATHKEATMTASQATDAVAIVAKNSGVSRPLERRVEAVRERSRREFTVGGGIDSKGRPEFNAGLKIPF